MSEENWNESPNGLLMPPAQPRARPAAYDKYPSELVEAVRGEFDGMIGNLQESIQSSLSKRRSLGRGAVSARI